MEMKEIERGKEKKIESRLFAELEIMKVCFNYTFFSIMTNNVIF